MKLNKAIAILLLSLANILLLAHGIMPHYHHDGIVCFIDKEILHLPCMSETDGDVAICCGHHTDTNHHHNQVENCDLKMTILRQADQSLQHNILHSVCCLSSLYFTDYYLNSFFLEEPDFGLFLQQKPYFENYISPFVGTISCLRGPPVYFLG